MKSTRRKELRCQKETPKRVTCNLQREFLDPLVIGFDHKLSKRFVSNFRFHCHLMHLCFDLSYFCSEDLKLAFL